LINVAPTVSAKLRHPGNPGYRETEYYVVRDPWNKQCSVTSAKPTSSTTMVVVGTTAYKTWEEAQAAVATVCK